MRRRLARVALAASAAAAVACARSSKPDLLEGVVITGRGHHELVLAAGRAPLPVVIGREDPVGLCLEAPAAADTSQWEASLRFRRGGDASEVPVVFHPPDVRSGATLCFTAPIPADLTARALSLCGELRDRFDGATASIPCAVYEFRSEDPEYAALRAQMRAALARKTATPSELVSDLDGLAARAEASSYPLLELRLRLIAAYMLRRIGTPEALEEAETRLAVSPAWIERAEASSWAAQLAYERATLALATSQLQPAWRDLRQAEERYRSVADPKLVTVFMKQAEILARVGALEEACDRLRGAVEACRDVPCEPALVPAAESTLAWLLLQDPDASRERLAEAERILRRASAGRSGADRLEDANTLVNVAHGAARGQGNPGPAFAAAARALDQPGARDTVRGRRLVSWLRVVEGEHALESGSCDHARVLCQAGLQGSDAAPLTARALSCTARSLEACGRLDEAAAVSESVLFLHAHSTSVTLGQSIALGPGQRADDFYRAARIAVERGRASDGWRILRDLDGLTAKESALSLCGRSGSEGPELDRDRDALVLQLVALEGPASGALRAQRQAIRRSLMERLQELARREPRCGDAPFASSDATVQFRAFALDDEVLVLRQRPSGEVVLYRRTALPRATLIERTREIDQRLALRRAQDSRTWAALVAPLAQALVPDPADLGSVTTFAMHGALQGVPLAALPVPASSRWLGDVTVVAYRPSGAAARTTDRRVEEPTRLFLVNPSGDLAAGAGLGSFYRSAFPQSRVLEGQDASMSAMRRLLPAAAWLHIDGHVRYDPAFPELTEIVLSDGSLTAADLATSTRRLALANLSACRSGSWPLTADSGRFGLAGLLARGGAEWVVGTRADLPDEVAADFNRGFYSALAGGRSVPEAYAAAMRQVRGSHPVTSWAGILLLQSEPAIEGGRFASTRTPFERNGRGGMQ